MREGFVTLTLSLTSETPAVPMHIPFVQASLFVHASPSLQEVPFGLAGLVHTPVAELQVPASWH